MIGHPTVRDHHPRASIHFVDQALSESLVVTKVVEELPPYFTNGDSRLSSRDARLARSLRVGHAKGLAG